MFFSTDEERVNKQGMIRLAERVQIALTGMGVLIVSLGLFAVIQSGAEGLAGNDGYYHIKMAWLMRQQGLKPLFVWLPHSILNPGAYYDHHFLYHLYLMLFVPGGSATSPQALVTAAKQASVLMPSLAFVAVWWLLRGQGVPWAGLWAVGLFAVSDAFLYRMSMARAQSASLLVLTLGLNWLLTRRYVALGPLAFVYVWLYNAFPLIALVALVVAVITQLTDRRFEWQPLAYVVGGIAIGMIANPYFPENVAFVVNHLLPKLGDVGTRVGIEWFPYDTWTLVQNSTGALVAMMLGVLALALKGKRSGRSTLVSLVLALVFGLLLLKARRFVEYFPAFALVFAALAVSDVLRDTLHRRARLLLATALVLALGGLGARNVPRARDALAGSERPDLFAEAATWLANNSPPGSLIFQTDWDDFPRLFFYNVSNLYTIGLDVTYMQLYSAPLYDDWTSITLGEVAEPSEVIASKFGASYVFSDLHHETFLEVAALDPKLREVYRDGEAVIYEVLWQP